MFPEGPKSMGWVNEVHCFWTPSLTWQCGECLPGKVGSTLSTTLQCGAYLPGNMGSTLSTTWQCREYLPGNVCSTSAAIASVQLWACLTVTTKVPILKYNAANNYQNFLRLSKHCKNCECCPVSQLIVR